MTTATLPSLRQLTDAELSQRWGAGLVDLPTVEAECKRRDAADRAAARAAAERAAWLDAANAQREQAERDCRGYLLAAGSAVTDALSLWRGSEVWARGQASEELRNWWDVNGRLSLAEYRRQQAMSARAYRDERDLDAMPAPSAREMAEQAAAAPRTAARPAGSIAGMIRALGHLQRQADRTARAMARMNGGQR